MTRYYLTLTSVCVATALLMLAGCTPLVEGAKKSANSLKQAGEDTNKTWQRLFTYDPPPETPQPADTRYCYRYSSDIVCYDAPQPQLTSKVVGVQGPEGARIVNYSEAAIPLRDTYAAPITAVETTPDPETVTSGPISKPVDIAPASAPKPQEATPFHAGASPYSQ